MPLWWVGTHLEARALQAEASRKPAACLRDCRACIQGFNITCHTPSPPHTCTCTPHRDLSSNTLSGELPPAWDQLQALQRLALDDNVLSGPLPGPWHVLRNLSELGLAGNHLAGPVPAEWASFTLLRCDARRTPFAAKSACLYP